jgi:hypothetical protein
MSTIAPTPSAEKLNDLYEALDHLLDVFIADGNLTDDEEEAVEMVDAALDAVRPA